MSEKMKTIFELIMRINAETDFSAFLSIHGHVNKMSINVGKGKECKFNEKIYEVDFYYTGVLKDTDRHVQTIINNLKEILEV